ncbi:N-acetyltransferase family protein [Phytobacter sp. V91]|uniref:GNAT family N-acetyltransferase n=1 Tax=Phytobacter sp. V91 TaxID=3369425 RepID=UPI003F601A95
MLTINRAQISDAPLLHTMGCTSYHHHFAHLWQEKDELANFLEQEYSVSALQQSLQDDSCCWLIASDDSGPVGFAKFSWHQQVTAGGPAGTLLHKLYLLPQTTGKGYGEQMINDVIHRARARGERFFWLEVLEANHQARRFYERQGLEHLQDTVFSTPSQQSTLHILGKSI